MYVDVVACVRKRTGVCGRNYIKPRKGTQEGKRENDREREREEGTRERKKRMREEARAGGGGRQRKKKAERERKHAWGHDGRAHGRECILTNTFTRTPRAWLTYRASLYATF